MSSNIIHTPVKGVFALAKTWMAVISVAAFFVVFLFSLFNVALAVGSGIAVYMVFLGYHLVVRDSHYQEVSAAALLFSILTSAVAVYGTGASGFSILPVVFVALLLLGGSIYRYVNQKTAVHTPYEAPKA